MKGPVPGVPSPPYLEKLTRLVSRENEVRNDVQKWRNLKVLDELERKFMERDDAGPNKVYNNKKGSDNEYNDVFGKTPNQGTEEEEEEETQEEEDEREDVNDQEDEKEEEDDENDKEMIDEGKEEKSDEKDNNKDGKDENTDKNREKKARLEDLLLRELENLKKD